MCVYDGQPFVCYSTVTVEYTSNKLLRNSINAMYRLAGKIFSNLSRLINRYGNYRYSYHFSVFTLINSINGRYDKCHLAELDNDRFDTSKFSYRGNGLINCPFLIHKFINFNLIRYYRRNLTSNYKSNSLLNFFSDQA